MNLPNSGEDTGRKQPPPCRARSVSWPITSRVGPGLEGAVVSETRVSCIDGERGSLSYRGIPIETLAKSASFEDVAALLIANIRIDDDAKERQDFRQDLLAGREIPEDVVSIVTSLPRETHPMRLLRAGISALGCFEDAPGHDLAGKTRWQAHRIVGQIAALVGVIARHRSGRAHEPRDPGTSIAEGLLTALQGARLAAPSDRGHVERKQDGDPPDEPSDRRPTDEDIRTLDLCLVLYADHGMDAPTFTSMIVGSCLADPYDNLVAGLSALRGPRVGGAGEEILKALLKLQDEDHARRWVRQTLRAGRRIPGFGHRVFRVPDPRVAVLRRCAEDLAHRRQAEGAARDSARRRQSGGAGENPAHRRTGDSSNKDNGYTRLFDIARAVVTEATTLLAPKQIHPNVNLYAALVFHFLGAEAELIPCLVAVGRTVGLVARVREYLAHNRLFRPVTRYVGPAERPFVPLEAR